MNLYGLDYSLLDMGFADPALVESLRGSHPMYADRRYRGMKEEEDLIKLSTSLLKNTNINSSPPKHRHDGTSPLPLGMDWSPPPRNWDGPSTTWPHDCHTGWSYCVTIPSCSIVSESGGSEPVVFYRVQVGLQSPEGVTTTREVLRRFSDFLKLSSDLKRTFGKKKLPPAPQKGILRMKSRELLEERRWSLEDWMTKVLSDIDFSRSAPVACFLELEAAVRSSFNESDHDLPNLNLSHNNGSSSDPFSNRTAPEDTTSAKPSEILNLSDVHQEVGGSSRSSVTVEASGSLDTLATSDLQSSDNALEFLQMEEQQKMKRLFTTMQQHIEDLTARLDQELAARQYLTRKVTDLETELESTKTSSKESPEQATSIETERFAHVEQDMEELRRKYVEMESRLKTEQDERVDAEATKTSIIRENETLRQELGYAKEQIKDLQKCLEEAELKSKS